MRSTYILFIFLLFHSCGKEAIYQGEAGRRKIDDTPSVVFYNGVRTLSFGSQAQADDAILRRTPIDAAALGVETFAGESEKHLSKIDSILTLNLTPEDIIRRYSEQQRSASEFLLFSENEAPVCRAKNLLEANIANKQGVYLVDGKVINIDRYNSFSERLSDPYLRYVTTSLDEGELRANNAFAVTNNRKARIELRLDPRLKAISIRLSAQKKTLFWWSRYSTLIYGRLTVTDLSIPFNVVRHVDTFLNSSVEPIRLELDEGTLGLKNAPFTLETGVKSTIHLGCRNEVSEYVFPFGSFNLSDSDIGENSGIYPRMRGSIEVWSRGIIYEHRAKDVIEVDFEY